MSEKQPKSKRSVCRTTEGALVAGKLVPKRWRDTYIYHLGKEEEPKQFVTTFDPDNPLGGKVLLPGRNSPICQQCGLDEAKSQNPYMPYRGPDAPLVTIVVESLGPEEDAAGRVGVGGWNGRVAGLIAKFAPETGVSLDQVRWVAATRCANRTSKQINYKIKANWCRLHLVDDLNKHRPKIIIPVGTVALGALSFKSNAQDWAGYELTYRGWPDDWLMNPAFVKPRPHPDGDPKHFIAGHPLFGKLPDFKIPIIAIQSPRLVYAAQNDLVTHRWQKQLKTALIAAKNGITVKNYDRKWYRITDDPREVAAALDEIRRHPGMLVSFDTETNGLRAFDDGSAIVFAMFRWQDPVTGEPKSIGFPWDYEGSPIRKHIKALAPRFLGALYCSRLVGHNVTFDMLFAYGTVPCADINRLADAVAFDTWHEAYVARQQRGTLGLDKIAYDYVPDLAGYEEDMTILIDQEAETMHPDNGQQAHYANCPKDKWDTHLKPYVMGDTEVCYRAHVLLQDKLRACRRYAIPLAHPTHHGMFRSFTPPGRDWVYEKIMAPAARMLIKLMGRGLYVSIPELARQEDLFPELIVKQRDALRDADQRIVDWCQSEMAQDRNWELDLDKKDQLKHILFDILKLPIQRLTKGGKALYGDPINGTWYKRDDRGREAPLTQLELEDHAALDKFTLNKMAADHPNVRPLQAYRKLFKLYSTYVRPLRNAFNSAVDNKQRGKHQHLCPVYADDGSLSSEFGVVHGSFLITGTRGGRLCLGANTKLCVRLGSDSGREVCVEIKDIHKVLDSNPYILTHKNRWKKVIAVYLKGYDQMYRVSSASGNTVDATAGHRVRSSAGWWDQVGALSVGDRLVSASGAGAEVITEIRLLGQRLVYDLEVQEDHSYAAHGFFHHNSSRNPNLQNLSRKGEPKKMFVSRFGSEGCMYQADLSQIELRLMACASGDESMLDAYAKNIDLHSLTASKIFKIPYENFTKEHFQWLQEHKRDDEVKKLEQKRSISKCVDPDTLVSVDGRITRVGSVHSGREHDQFYAVTDRSVQTPTGFRPIKRFYANGEAPRVLVCCKHGLIACSLTHRFQCVDGRLVAAKDLKKGDVLTDAIDLVSQNKPTTTLSFDPLSTGIISPAFQINVTCDLAYALGLFYGDGCVNTNSLAITTGGKEDFFEWQDIVADALCRNGFGTKIVRTVWNGTKHSKMLSITGSYGQIIFGSRRLIDIFEQLGAVCRTGERCVRTLRVPDWLFNASEEVRLSFLGGLLDTDGYVRKGESLSVCTKSWLFAQDIVVLLRSLGFCPTLYPAWNKTYAKFYFIVSVPKRNAVVIKPYLRHPDKKNAIHPLKFSYAKQQSNKVVVVLSLEEAPLVDISLDSPHLYVANGFTTHNTANFLTGYGGGAFGLQTSLANNEIYLALEECEIIVDAFFAGYPTLKKFLGRYKSFIQSNGVALSMFGRVRIFEEVFSGDQELVAKALRAGANHLIQATASDMMLLALVAVESMMREAGLESILVSTVHDSLLADCRRSELPEIHDITMTVMNNFDQVLPLLLGDNYDTSWLLTNFSGDAEAGLNYLELAKIGDKPDWDKLVDGFEHAA